MTKPLTLRLLAVTTLLASMGCGPAGVLARIESYRAPPFPASQYSDREAYDYRVRDNTPVPPTLTDTFVLDIWQRVSAARGAVPPPSLQEVAKGISVYVERDWEQIASLRPWTHWNFVRGLTPEERAVLAEEVARHIGENGVEDPDDAPDYLGSTLVLAEREVKPGDDVHFTIILNGTKDGKRLCLSHIQDRPQRWIYRSLIGSGTCEGALKPLDGEPYEGAPKFGTLARGSTLSVSGTIWIPRQTAEGDYTLFVSIPHWPHGCWLDIDAEDTWPAEYKDCWLGQIISKAVPLRIAAHVRPAEPSRATGAASE